MHLIALVFLNLGWLTSVQGQDVARLWEGQTKPYYKDNTLVEREEKVWGTGCAVNVTEPTLTIYPAQGKKAGVGVVIIPGGNYQVVAIHHEGYGFGLGRKSDGTDQWLSLFVTWLLRQ